MTNEMRMGPLTFRRSSASSGSGTNCVEAGVDVAGEVCIRDSKDCTGAFGEYPALAMSREAWQGFTEAVKNDRFA